MTLDDVRTDSLAALVRGARDRGSPMHTPAVASADGDLRTMVLRGVDGWTLRFHTDARAPKVDAIAARAGAGALFYDRQAGLQLRVRGIGRIETMGAAVDAAWAASDNYARRCYLGAPPGERLDAPGSGLPDWIEGEKPTDDQLVPARENFALLWLEMHEIDWYRLAHDGHRRALVTKDDGWWLTP